MKKNWIIFLIILVLLFSNFIWSLVGILIAVIHIPYSVHYSGDNYSFIIRVNQAGILDMVPGYRKWRGVAMGNIVVLNRREEQGDETHELIHVEQFMRYPGIFPLLYHIETYKNGYRQNKFEVEAYDRARNIYH